MIASCGPMPRCGDFPCLPSWCKLGRVRRHRPQPGKHPPPCTFRVEKQITISHKRR
jgi:hypothetical protein